MSAVSEVHGWKVFFGHVNSVGVYVEATTEKEAKIAAMTLLRNNRGETGWDARHYVNWEERIGDVVYALDPSEPESVAGFILKKESGDTIYAGPPTARDFGSFPPIAKVELVG